MLRKDLIHLGDIPSFCARIVKADSFRELVFVICPRGTVKKFQESIYVPLALSCVTDSFHKYKLKR